MPVNWYDTLAEVPNVPGVAIVDAGSTRTVLTATTKRVAVLLVNGYGPRGTKYLPVSAQDVLQTFWPFGPDAGGAFLAFGGLKWPGLKVTRLSAASGQVKGTVTIQDGQGSPANSVVITARDFGVDATRVSAIITANADDATKRDLRLLATYTDQDGVTRNGYDVTYPAFQASNGTVTDPGDRYFTVTKASGATHAAAAGTYPIASGANGTVSDAELTAALSLYNGDTDVETIVVLGVPSGDVADFNAALTTWATSTDRAGRVAVLCTPTGIELTDAITNAGTWASKGLRYLWPRVTKRCTYGCNGLTVSVSGDTDGAGVYASVLQRLSPWESPFGSTWADTRSVSGYSDVESGLTVPDVSGLEAASAAGVMVWRIDTDYGGLVPHDDLTTGLDASGIPVRGFAARYTDFLGTQLARIAKPFISKPLDIDLATPALGAYSRQLYGAFTAFLRTQTSDGHLIAGLNSDGTASPAFSVDMFSYQTADNLAQGKSIIGINARITPNLRVLVLFQNIGTTVDITATVV